MNDLRTISPDELAELGEVPEDLRALVFSPTGPLQAIPYTRLIAKLIAADNVKATKALLDADLAHPADAVALVFSDPTAALNGWYRKLDASGAGSWEQFEELARNSRILAQAAAQSAAESLSDVTTAVNGALDGIAAAGSAATDQIAIARGSALDDVEGSRVAAVGSVGDAGAAQIGAVASEGAEQIALAAEQVALAAAAAGSVVRANLLALEAGIDRPEAMIFQSGAGRWRRTATGYVPALANEERRAFNNDGSFGGVAYELGDTYAAPPLNDKTAIGGGSDLRTFTISNQGTDVRAYPGAHAEPDILGGTGAGIVITQGNSSNAFGSFANINRPVLAGQQFIIEYGVIIEGATAPAQVALRCSGGRTFAFPFDHDATGLITGFTENWATYKAAVSPPEMINGKRVQTLHVLTTATANGNVVPGFGWPGAQPGRKITIAFVKVRVAPVAPATSYPVFGTGANGLIVLGSDEIQTGLGAGFGYIMQDIGLARSVMPNGKITVPPVVFGGSLSPVERKIRIVRSPTAVDRAGPMHTGREDYHFRPWLSAGLAHAVFAGPGAFPNPIGWSDAPSTCLNLSITPVFAERAPDLAPALRKVTTSQTYITGALSLAGTTLHAATHDQVQYWQQSDIPNSSASASHWINARTDIDVSDTLMLGCPVEHTRARHFAQVDATRNHHQYVGEILAQTHLGGAVNFARSRADSLARISPSGGTSSAPFTLNCEDTFQNHIWSDNWFMGQGVITCTFRRVVQGPGTAQSMDMYQSRREILVNLLDGSGWQTLAAAGKTIANLPYGRRAKHVGTFNFGTLVETSAPEHGEFCIVRNFEFASSSGVTSKPGMQWNASQVTRGDHTRMPRIGDVFVLTGEDRVTGLPMQVKITADLGLWNLSNVWVPGVNPATPATGTHPDHLQVNRFSCTITFAEFSVVYMYGEGQGPFQTGDPALSGTGSIVTTATYSKLAMALSTSNAFRSDWSRSPMRTATLTQSIFAQAANPYRYADGSQVRMNIGAAGPNNTLAVDPSVIVSSDNAGVGGVSISSGAVLTGSLTFIPTSSIASYSTVTDPTAKPQLRDLVEPQFIDPVSRLVALPEDFRDFRWSALAESLAGWSINQTFISLVAYHDRRSGAFVADWERLFIEPDTANVRVIRVPNNTAVGSVLATGLRGSDWHWFWGAARDGWVTLDNQGRAILARALTGINRMLSPMMTSAEEVLIFDVVTP